MGDELEKPPLSPAQQAQQRTSQYRNRQHLLAQQRALSKITDNPDEFEFGSALEAIPKDIFGVGDTFKSMGNGIFNAGASVYNYLGHGAVGEITKAAGFSRPPKIELKDFSPLGPPKTHLGGITEVMSQYLAVHGGSVLGGKYLKASKLFRGRRAKQKGDAFSESPFALNKKAPVKKSNYLGLKGSNSTWFGGVRKRFLTFYAFEHFAFDAQQPNLAHMMHEHGVSQGWDKDKDRGDYMKWLNEAMMIPELLANNPEEYLGKEMSLVEQFVNKAKSLPESAAFAVSIEAVCRAYVIQGFKSGVRNTVDDLNKLDDELARELRGKDWRKYPASVKKVTALEKAIAGGRASLMRQLDNGINNKVIDIEWERNFLRDEGYRADPAVKGIFGAIDEGLTSGVGREGTWSKVTHAMNQSDALPKKFWEDVTTSFKEMPEPFNANFKIANAEDIAAKAKRTPQGRGRVGAWVQHNKDGSNTVFFDLEQIDIMWETKAWNTPKAKDAVALPRNAFKDKDEFIQFVIEHERAHILHPKNKSEKAINKIALNKVKELRTKKGVLEPDPLKRDVVSVDFSRSPYAETHGALIQLDPRNGTIAMDYKAIDLEWQEALKTGELPFLSGTRQSTRATAFGPSTMASAEMGATLYSLGVDPKKLFAAFRSIGGDVDGVRFYQQFLELRARHLLAISKREGIAVDLLGIHHPQYSKFATEAVYNALTKNRSAGGLGFADTSITRPAKPHDYIPRNATDRVKNDLHDLVEADKQLVKEFADSKRVNKAAEASEGVVKKGTPVKPDVEGKIKGFIADGKFHQSGQHDTAALAVLGQKEWDKLNLAGESTTMALINKGHVLVDNGSKKNSIRFMAKDTEALEKALAHTDANTKGGLKSYSEVDGFLGDAEFTFNAKTKTLSIKGEPDVKLGISGKKPTDELLTRREALQQKANKLGIPIGKTKEGVSIFEGLIQKHDGRIADNILREGAEELRKEGVEFITVDEVQRTLFQENGLSNLVKILKDYRSVDAQKGLDQYLYSSAGGGGAIWNTRTQGSMQSANATFAGLYHVFTKHMNTVYTDPDAYARAMGWKGNIKKGIDRSKVGGKDVKGDEWTTESSKDFLIRKIDEEFELLSRESDVNLSVKELKEQAAEGKGMFDNGEGGLKDLRGGARNKNGELSAIGDVRDLHVRIISARMLIQNTADEINTAAIKLYDKRQLLLAKGEDLTAKEQVEFAELLTRQMVEIDTLAQVKTASARSMRAMHDLDRLKKHAGTLNPEQEDEVYKQLLASLEESEGFTKVLLQLDVIASQLKDSPTIGGRKAYVNALNRAKVLRRSTGWNDLVKAHNDIWINSLLFNGQTQVVNFTSNAVNFVFSNVERLGGSFAPESWFKNQRDIFGEEMSGAMAKAVARSRSFHEVAYSGLMAWDIINMMFRGTDDFMANASNLDGVIAGRKADSLEVASRSMAALKNPEHNLLGKGTGTHLDSEMRAGGDATSENIGAGLTRIGYTVGDATGMSIEALGKNKAIHTLAVVWDGFYKHYLRNGAKITVAGDQFFKRMHMQASAHGSLTAYAINVKGMTDKKKIAEWVAVRKGGLSLPNGQPFSEANLTKLAIKTAGDNGITNKDELSGYVKWFKEKNQHLEDRHGNIIISAPLREQWATEALRYSDDLLFQTGLDDNLLALHIRAGGTKENFGKKLPSGEQASNYKPSFSKWVADATNEHPLLKIVLPFVKTPVNLWKALYNRVPYIGKFAKQALDDLSSGDPQRVAQVYGRQLTGYALFTGSYQLVKQGAVTAGLSNNPARRANEFSAGDRPWTITDSNGKQWDYSRMEWASTPLKIMAQYHETMEYLQDDPAYEEAWLDWGTAGVGVVAAVGTDSTYLRGMSEFLNLVRDLSTGEYEGNTEEFLQAAEARFASYIPRIPRDFLDSVDDTYRKHSTAGDKLLVRLFPFGVPPLRDPITGRVIKKHRSYPHPLIHMLTPVKRYSHNVSSFIAQEMVSLHSHIQPIDKKLFNKDTLKMHQHYANFTGSTKEMSEEARRKGRNYRLPPELGGAKCPVAEGQSFYDFLQQYISVRKVEFKNIGLINSSITVPADDGENGARIAQLFEDIKDNKKLSVKASLEDVIHTVVQMEAYQAIPLDAGVGQVSYRATIIQNIVSKWRADAKAELLGEVEDLGNRYDPREGDGTTFLPIYTGPIYAFWPELAKMAGKENWENLWIHQGKNVFDAPANKSKYLDKENKKTFGYPKPTGGGKGYDR